MTDHNLSLENKKPTARASSLRSMGKFWFPLLTGILSLSANGLANGQKASVLLRCTPNVIFAANILDSSIESIPEKTIVIKDKINSMLGLIKARDLQVESGKSQRFVNGCTSIFQSTFINDEATSRMADPSFKKDHPFISAIFDIAKEEPQSFFSFGKKETPPPLPTLENRLISAQAICNLMSEDNELRYFFSLELDDISHFSCNPNVRGQPNSGLSNNSAYSSNGSSEDESSGSSEENGDLRNQENSYGSEDPEHQEEQQGQDSFENFYNSAKAIHEASF